MKKRGAWKRLVTLGTYVRGKMLVVTLGADDPTTLNDETAFKTAIKIAKRRGFKNRHRKGHIHTKGQNALATRTFYFKK